MEIYDLFPNGLDIDKAYNLLEPMGFYILGMSIYTTFAKSAGCSWCYRRGKRDERFLYCRTGFAPCGGRFVGMGDSQQGFLREMRAD